MLLVIRLGLMVGGGRGVSWGGGVVWSRSRGVSRSRFMVGRNRGRGVSWGRWGVGGGLMINWGGGGFMIYWGSRGVSWGGFLCIASQSWGRRFDLNISLHELEVHPRQHSTKNVCG